MSVIEPSPWWPRIGIPLIAAMSTALPRRVLGHVARGRHQRVAALEGGDRGLEARRGEELERREHAAVDVAGLDVAAAAVVDADPRIVEDALLQRLLGHQQDLPDGRVLGVRAEEGVLARRAVDRGGLEQLPAVEDRLGIDPRRALAGRADLEEEVRRDVLLRLAQAAEDGAGHDLGAHLELLDRDVLAVQAQDLGELRLVAGAAGLELAVEELLLAAGLVGRGARRVGERALLGARRPRPAAASAGRRRPWSPARRRRRRRCARRRSRPSWRARRP